MLIRSLLSFALSLILVLQIFSGTQFGIADSGIRSSHYAFAQTSGSSQPSYTPYQNNNEGVSIDYPSNWTYSEQTQGGRMTTSFSPYHGSATLVELFYDKTTNYVGTDQQKLEQFPQIISNICSGATIARLGFACSGFQYKTGIANYRGIPSYFMESSMIETFSDGSSREQDMAQFLVITQNSDYGIIVSCPKVECDSYHTQLNHFLTSLNIYSIATPTSNSAASTQSTSYNIPNWIKNTAKWWAAGQVADSDFIEEVQYLIQNGIIVVPTTQVSSQPSQGIPSWVKNTAKWWAAGQLEDADFIKGIQYLVQNGIIVTQGEQASNRILDGATFYTGNRTEPQTITYVDKNGNSANVLAIPNQVLLYVSSSTPFDTVNKLISDNGGTILSKIPNLGFYLVQTDDVSSFISSVYQSSYVSYASPNIVVSPADSSVVDLSKVKSGKDVVPLLHSPDPKAKVILVQIDDFYGVYGKYNGGQSHGTIVGQAIDATIGGIPVEHIQVFRYLQDNYMTADTVENALATAIAGAQLNGQKVVINLSIVCGCLDPRTAQNNWQNLETIYINAISQSDWVKSGNVIIAQAAGNSNTEISDQIKSLSQNQGTASTFNNVFKLFGQTTDQGDTATYVNGGSNRGDGLLYHTSNTPCGAGTSCVAPIGAATLWKMWNDNPNLSGPQIGKILENSGSKDQKGHPTFDPQNAIKLAAQASASSVGNKIGTNGNPTNANQGNNPSNANQGNQGRYGSYNTPDAYCKGNYGSDYYYDASRNVCAPRLQYSNQGSNALGIDLTGEWGGTARGTIVYTDPDPTYNINCNFQANISLNLEQIKNSLTGDISVTGLSLSGQNCDQIEYSQFGGNLRSTIFGSGFSGTAGPLSVTGQFTSDLMSGHYSGDVEDHTINGDFTASRTG